MSARQRKTTIGLVLFTAVLALTLSTWAHGGEYQVQATPEMAQAGKATFALRCAICHDARSNTPRKGPGLKGLYKAQHPVTDAGVRDQIQKGGKRMPAFPNIKGKELDNLIAFLKTL